MAMDVALTSAMRSNLLTLQSTQSGIDKVQGILATGRKVNSALDNPSSFFAAQSLNNRASDLGRLLDSMGQNISTIKQADKGVSSLTKLVDQADAIANQAATAASGSGQQATLSGSVKLTGSQDVTALSGVAANNTFSLTFEVNDESGDKISTLGSGGNATSVTVTVAAGSTVDQMIADINAQRYGPTGSQAQAIEAKLNDEGKLEIKSLTGGDMRITLDNGNDNDPLVPASSANDINLAKALGFGDQALSLTTGAPTGTSEVSLTATSKPMLMSTSFRTSAGTDFATASTKLADLVDADNNRIFQASGAVAAATPQDVTGNKLVIGVNGKTEIEVADFTLSYAGGGAAGTVSDSSTIQDLVDTINTHADLKDSIRATYDAATGHFSIQAISTSVQTVQVGLRANESTTSGDTTGLTASNLGFGVNPIAASIESDGTPSSTVTGLSNFTVGAAAGELARLENDYNVIRTQIDQLVQDSGYAGVNLLKGDNLRTTFNADRTSSLTTKGKSFTSEGLGISKANFSSAQAIDSALGQLRSAKSEVRNFGSSLANDLSVIQTRQDFTKETINNLQEGSDKLTLADKNEEGAKLLALQTQQQLGVISLSMASQSAQSVLRLF
jgi:flagellin